MDDRRRDPLSPNKGMVDSVVTIPGLPSKGVDTSSIIPSRGVAIGPGVAIPEVLDPVPEPPPEPGPK